jgi:hypothetical protein
MAGSVPLVSAAIVFWGALLCSLGYWAFLAGMATYKSETAAADGVVVLPCVFFATTLLVTLTALNLLWISSDTADLFDWADLLDWIDN